ncbi:MAG: hypothetical protein ABSF74_03175 [Dehalococcoidia bacterium]
MNNWFKIGMPVLVVILLIVCAVTITLLVTRYGSDRTISTTSPVPLRASTQYAGTALCPNCPGYIQSAAVADQGSSAAPSSGYVGMPSCHVTATQGSTTTGVNGRASCCGGYLD